MASVAWISSNWRRIAGALGVGLITVVRRFEKTSRSSRSEPSKRIDHVLRFTWDPAKAAQNVRKHRVGFAEACSIFGDRLALDIDDPVHSEDELRFVILGTSDRRQLLVVVYAEPRVDEIRIISARRATPRERRNYEKL